MSQVSERYSVVKIRCSVGEPGTYIWRILDTHFVGASGQITCTDSKLAFGEPSDLHPTKFRGSRASKRCAP